MSADLFQDQRIVTGRDGRVMHPNSLGNLNPIEPGRSGNPGGRTRGPNVSSAIERLLALDPGEEFQPANNAEAIAWETIKQARRGKKAPTERVLNRTEGGVRQRLRVEADRGPDEMEMIRSMAEAAMSTGLNREQAISSILESYRELLEEAIPVEPLLLESGGV